MFSQRDALHALQLMYYTFNSAMSRATSGQDDSVDFVAVSDTMSMNGLASADLPLAGKCSLVISAACHASLVAVDPQLERVQWDVVQSRCRGEIEHCTLSRASE